MPAQRRFSLLAVLLVLILLAFVAAEIYLRSQHADFREAHKELEQTFQASEIPGLIYERKPGSTGANALGFRDSDCPCKKPADTWRVVVLGDSVAMGRGVALEESFGKRLEHFLNHQRTAGMPEVQVCLMAEEGYNTAQKLRVLEYKALQCEPDLIVWAYSLDDPAHVLFHEGSAPHARYFYDPLSRAALGVRRLLFQARERFQGAGEDADVFRRLHNVYRQQLERQMKHLGQLSQRADVPVLLLVLPVLETEKLADDPGYVVTPMDYRLLDVHTLVTRMALQNDIAVVEGLDAFMGRRVADLLLSKEDILHPNAAGHELWALQLQKHMLRHGPYPGEPAQK